MDSSKSVNIQLFSEIYFAPMSLAICMSGPCVDDKAEQFGVTSLTIYSLRPRTPWIRDASAARQLPTGTQKNIHPFKSRCIHNPNGIKNDDPNFRALQSNTQFN